MALVLSLVFSQVALAGWSSGGGELLRDQINPWFLRNVSEVRYCILIDEENFGQTKSQVKPRIEKAIQFWKMQFRDLQFFHIDSHMPAETAVNLEKIQFVESECQDSTDIKFQFGILEETQRKRIPNINNFIALTIRTDYAIKSLRGKGFIYFAPQDGPLKPTSTQVVDKFWNVSNGSLLFPVIVHELGHIFGLQHRSELPLMDEGFVESVVSKERYQNGPITVPDYFEDFEREGWEKILLFRFSTLAPRHNFATCSASEPTPTPVLPKPPTKKAPGYLEKNVQKVPVISEIFGFPKSAVCYTYEIVGTKFMTKYTTAESTGWKIAGEMELEGPSTTVEAYYTTMILSIWIPLGQEVFKGDYVRHQSKIPLAYMFSEFPFKGTYFTKDGQHQHRMLITAAPSGIKTIGGVYKGEIYKDFNRGF